MSWYSFTGFSYTDIAIQLFTNSTDLALPFWNSLGGRPPARHGVAFKLWGTDTPRTRPWPHICARGAPDGSYISAPEGELHICTRRG